MNSLSIKTTWTVWVLCLLGLLVSCQDTIPQRSTITPGSSTGKLPLCEEGEELVLLDKDENELPAGTDPSSPEVVEVFCREKAPVRPDNAVFWKTNFCACKDGKPVSYGNCAAFCSDKNTNGAEMLYASFNVSEAISLGGLGNVYAWCKVNLPGDTANPECELQAKDESGNITTLDVNVPVNTNSITADIKDRLSYDKTYVLTLVEKTSGAKSNSIQLIKFSTDTNLAVLGPLKNVPVSQYSCMVREFSTDENTGDIYYDHAYRIHYYFIPRIPPKPVPGGNSNLICHDIFNPLYGAVDQETYPRFEQLPGIFNLWDTTDPRFYDNNGNGQVDINEVIVQKTRNFGGVIPTGTEFFKSFSWQSSPQLDDDSSSNTVQAQPFGYYMAPWIDQSTFLSFCLNSSHYNSSNPLYKAMRDIIGVDTEGLYVAVKSPETVRDSQGNYTTGFYDFIFIRESDLKAVWFYLKNGVPTVPTDANALNEAVYFYYPLNKVSPFVRTSTQRIYRVYSAAELNQLSGSTGMGNGSVTGGSSTPGGNATSYPPHDRKIGCVPKF